MAVDDADVGTHFVEVLWENQGRTLRGRSEWDGGYHDLIDSVSGETVEWFTGSGEPGVELGKDGQLYMDVSTGYAYEKIDGAWVMVDRTFESLDTGTWRDGPTFPDDALGVDGDFYLAMDSGILYKRVGGKYRFAGRFPTLPMGATGVDDVVSATNKVLIAVKTARM